MTVYDLPTWDFSAEVLLVGFCGIPLVGLVLLIVILIFLHRSRPGPVSAWVFLACVLAAGVATCAPGPLWQRWTPYPLLALALVTACCFVEAAARGRYAHLLTAVCMALITGGYFLFLICCAAASAV